MSEQRGMDLESVVSQGKLNTQHAANGSSGLIAGMQECFGTKGALYQSFPVQQHHYLC